MKITSVVLEVQDAADIVTTAIEGGINYWGECKDYNWKGFYENYDDQKFLHEQKYRNIPQDEALVYVREDIESNGGDPVIAGNPWFALTIANLEDAVCKVLNSEYAHLINIRDGEIDVDATGAEVIVQYAVFGELVFA
jgi:hypothetical protein